MMNALRTIGFSKAVRFLWYGMYAWLIHVSLSPVRVVLLRLAGATVGTDTVIMDVRFINLHHYGFKRLTIGNKCFLGDEVSLDVRGGIDLADEVTLSGRVTIVTHINVGYHDHPLQQIYPTREDKVVLKRGCYIGTGAIILPGVMIGKKSVVGAGAVVTKHVADSVMVAGVPAAFIKRI